MASRSARGSSSTDAVVREEATLIGTDRSKRGHGVDERRTGFCVIFLEQKAPKGARRRKEKQGFSWWWRCSKVGRRRARHLAVGCWFDGWLMVAWRCMRACPLHCWRPQGVLRNCGTSHVCLSNSFSRTERGSLLLVESNGAGEMLLCTGVWLAYRIPPLIPGTATRTIRVWRQVQVAWVRYRSSVIGEIPPKA